MPHGFLNIAATPSVKDAQRANGSSDYWSNFLGERTFDRFRDSEAAFIAARDSFYMATVSETGWPYVQHRGGPPGFIRMLDDKTLAVADYRGNRQYITVGNLAAGGRASLIMVDYPARRRLKIYAHVEVKSLADDPELAAAAGDARLQGEAGTRAKIPPRRLRLELPATHHAALFRGGDRCGAGAGARSLGATRGGEQGAAGRHLRFIRPCGSGGGGPREAWWRGRLTRRVVAVEKRARMPEQN